MGHPAQRSDAELVAATIASDHEAYKELVSRYQGHVYGLAFSLVSNWADAQDITQETFIRAYMNLDQLQDKSRFPAWLRRVTFSVAMNWIRAFRPGLFQQLDGKTDLEHLQIPDFKPGPPELAEKRELADAVMQALASLPTKYRIPLTMFHLDGLSYQKVADFLDIPLGTAKSLIHRAQEKLKLLLPAELTKEMAVVQEVFNEYKPGEELAREIVRRISHWERFDGSADEKARMVMDDPEWRSLVEMEIQLEPVSKECRAIRKQIASMESCHEHYTDNVKDVLSMTGAMKPGWVLDGCGYLK